MVRIHHVKFLNLDWALFRICLPDHLEDARKFSPKLHWLWGDILIYSVINTRRHLAGLGQ